MARQFPPSEILDEDERLFKSWGSVEVRDQDGQLVPIDELTETMDLWMQRGAPISDGDHSDKIIGKGITWGTGLEPRSGEKGIWIIGKVHKNQPYDNEVWRDTKKGKRTGLSWSGRYHKIERIKKDGVPTAKLHGLETYAFALCEQPKNSGSLMDSVNFKASSNEADDIRAAAYLFRRGKTVSEIAEITKLDEKKIKEIIGLAIDDESQADAESASKSADTEFQKERKEHPSFTDEQINQIVADHAAKKGEDMPFAGYKNFAECVAKNKDKGDPDAYCATIMRQVEGKSEKGSMTAEVNGKKIYIVKDKYGYWWGEREGAESYGACGSKEECIEEAKRDLDKSASGDRTAQKAPLSEEEILRTFFSGKKKSELTTDEIKDFEKLERGSSRVGDLKSSDSNINNDKVKSSMANNSGKAGDYMVPGEQKAGIAGEQTPSPAGAGPAAGGMAEVIALLKQVLERLPPKAGEGLAAEANKGEGEKLNAGAEGGKVNLPESVGEKTTQMSPDKKVSGDTNPLSSAVTKAIAETVSQAVDAKFASKSATPRPDAAAPSSVQSALNPNPAPTPSLGLAYEVATGKKHLTVRELQTMQTDSSTARATAALKAIRAQAQGQAQGQSS